MKIISAQTIKSLGISPATCVEWVKGSFAAKAAAQLPAKISVHPSGIDFFTAMPCLLPEGCNAGGGQDRFYGTKIVHRLSGATPALGSDILLYDARTGKLLALADGDWITTMRTGAVATLAIQTLRKSGTAAYGIIGLGNTARATLLCLLHSEPATHHRVVLLRYKNQAEMFIDRFGEYGNVEFTIADSIEKLVQQADVIVSCITATTENLCADTDAFRPGTLVVPVHTRGFQNCDTVFDKVFADDTDHVRGFRYFTQFRQFAELQDVIEGKAAGRESDTERILSYNIGLGLHDIYFASRIYGMARSCPCPEVEMERETQKFWI